MKSSHLAKQSLSYDPDFGPYLLGHSERVARDTEHFMLHEGYDAQTARKAGSNMFFHDGGKTLQSIELWRLTVEKRSLTDAQKQERPNHGPLGEPFIDGIVDELGLPRTKNLTACLEAMKYQMVYHHERLNGTGPQGLAAAQMDPILQIITIIDTVDGKYKAKTLSEIFEDMGGAKHAGQFNLDMIESLKAFHAKANTPMHSSPVLAKQAIS